MIIGLLAQLALPAAITVHAAGIVTPVAIVNSIEGPTVRAQTVLKPLGGSVQSIGNGHYRVVIGGSTIDLGEGLPFAHVGNADIPLAGAPMTRDGAPSTDGFVAV